MRSALYEGTIRHRRFAVRERVFRHRLALVYVDLDELPRLFGGRLVARRPGIVRFRRADYLGDPAVPLADAVRALVARRTGVRPGRPGAAAHPAADARALLQPGQLLLLLPAGRASASRPSSPRSRTRRGASATPTCCRAAATARCSTASADKALHVSPFMGDGPALHVAGDPRPARRCRCTSRAREHGAPAFDATLACAARRSRGARWRGSALRYPAATLRVLALIYGHAAVLWLRRVPVHPHPAADGR